MNAAQLFIMSQGGAEFPNRVKYFYIKAAVAVLTEDPATVNHASRLQLAASIINGNMPDTYTLAVLTNATIGQNPDLSSDGDIEFVVNSVFGPLAIAMYP